jgi:hypothetical protein
MKKELTLLFLSVFFTVFFFKVFSTPSTCNNPISIGCGQTLTNLCTATGSYDYYNYTLYTDTDVHIMVDVFLGCYNMTTIWDYESCSSLNKDTLHGGCSQSLGTGIGNLEGSLEGNTYYILIRGLFGNDCGNSDYFYDLTLECGSWCGNGILETEKGEKCDYGNYENGTARCKPYEECRQNCRCYDLRQDAVGCDFYDYCEDGMNRTDYSLSCCVNATDHATPCCLDSLDNPWLNCSQVNYRRNPVAIALNESCYVRGYDITDVCIDHDALNNTLRIKCGSV